MRPWTWPASSTRKKTAKENVMRPIALTALLLGLFAGHAMATAEGQLYELEAAGEERSYKLFVPDNAAPKPLPLMIVMHGGLGNADETERTTGMNRGAAANGFIEAYHKGTCASQI